ncbi:MAG TPA: hypothetical protein DD666_07670 [Advenella kashmirensis]|uniref:Glycosyltransferase n=1 Tax=Advenella kashmirensis TaxID=310575 RepID=A0A356LEN0_9BURK|nr:hypothetical protein [Advenella kashmirensis]
MIIFVRSFIADFDGKIKKYFALFDKHAVKYHFVGWPRGTHQKQDSADETYYSRRAQLGGGLRNIVNILLWNCFLFRTLWKKRRQISVVHAIDLDSAACAWLFAKLFRKRVIFDVYDKYTDVRHFPGRLVPLVNRLENFLIQAADLSILADQNRYAQHGLDEHLSNVIVLENVPQEGIRVPLLPEPQHPIKLGYFGVLEPVNRGLEDMLAVVQRHPDKLIFHVVGYGPLAGVFERAAASAPNVVFHGAKSSQEGLAIMGEMDILLGMYYKTVRNHLFASPNKYYEHLMLGRPLVTTVGTPPGQKVSNGHTGWALEEGEDAIARWAESLLPENIVEMAKNARSQWDQVYESYFDTHYKDIYFARVQRLANKAD